MKLKKIIAGLICSTLFLGSTSVMAKSGIDVIEVMFRNMKVVVDGTELILEEDIEPFIHKGTTYLPVRSVAEALGKEVHFDNDTSTVYLGEKPASGTKKEVLLEDVMKNVQVFEEQLSQSTSFRSENYFFNRGNRVAFDKAYYTKFSRCRNTFYTNGNYESLKFKLVIPESSEGDNTGGILIGDHHLLTEYDELGENIFDVVEFSSKDMIGTKIVSYTNSDYGDSKMPLIQEGFTVMEYEVDIQNIELLTIELSNDLYMLDPILITSSN